MSLSRDFLTLLDRRAALRMLIGAAGAGLRVDDHRVRILSATRPELRFPPWFHHRSV